MRVAASLMSPRWSITGATLLAGSSSRSGVFALCHRAEKRLAGSGQGFQFFHSLLQRVALCGNLDGFGLRQIAFAGHLRQIGGSVALLPSSSSQSLS